MRQIVEHAGSTEFSVEKPQIEWYRIRETVIQYILIYLKEIIATR